MLCLEREGLGFSCTGMGFIARSVASFAETPDTNTGTAAIKAWVEAASPVAQIRVWPRFTAGCLCVYQVACMDNNSYFFLFNV